MCSENCWYLCSWKAVEKQFTCSKSMFTVCHQVWAVLNNIYYYIFTGLYIIYFLVYCHAVKMGFRQKSFNGEDWKCLNQIDRIGPVLWLIILRIVRIVIIIRTEILGNIVRNAVFETDVDDAETKVELLSHNIIIIYRYRFNYHLWTFDLSCIRHMHLECFSGELIPYIVRCITVYIMCRRPLHVSVVLFAFSCRIISVFINIYNTQILFISISLAACARDKCNIYTKTENKSFIN